MANFNELKKTKKFNGKIYKLHSETGYMKSAKEKASNLRKIKAERRYMEIYRSSIKRWTTKISELKRK